MKKMILKSAALCMISALFLLLAGYGLGNVLCEVKNEKASPVNSELHVFDLEEASQFKRAFVVGIDPIGSWRDMVVLASVPVAFAANNRMPVLLLSLLSGNGRFSYDDSIEHFLETYKPDEMYYVGGTPPDQQMSTNIIEGNNEIELASNLADRFWESSETVVLASNRDYPSCLLASSIAAHLTTPLLYLNLTHISNETQNSILNLGSTKALVVGNCSDKLITELQYLELNVTVLSDAVSVAKYLNIAKSLNYTVLVNPRDRFYPGKVPRLSLLSSVIAAYRNGVIFPADYDAEWKVTFYANSIATARPSGSTDGGNRSFFCYQLTDNAPPMFPGSRWEAYPVNGKYAYGKLPLIAGTYWHDISFYLASSRENASKYDTAMIDLNEDKAISDSELLIEDGTFTINSRTYTVLEISGDGRWDGTSGFLQLKFVTWKTGTIFVSGQGYSFVATSAGYGTDEIGCYDTVDIDLNSDGHFNDTGEACLHSSDTIFLNGKKYALTVGVGERAYAELGDVRLTYPTADVIREDLKHFYNSSNLDPKYLAILGYYDAIPFAITFKPYPDVEDMVSDITYGDFDNDTFVETSTGRLLASDVYKASALIARIVSYSALLSPDWMGETLTMADRGDGEAIARTMEHNMQNVGFNTTGLYRSYSWDNSYLQHKAIIFHFNHASTSGWSQGPWTSSMQNIELSPLLAVSGGCLSAGLDLTPPEESIAVAFLDKGAIAYIGNTRPASNPMFSYLGSLFDGLIYRGLTLGQAHTRSQNLKVKEYIEGNNDRYDLIAAHEATLFGDPAQTLCLPSPPTASPAIATIASDSPSGQIIEYKGPEVWWNDQIENYEGKILHSRSGPGVFFENFMDNVRFLVCAEFPHDLYDVVQETKPAPPLGWTGGHFTDKYLNNKTSVYWTLQPIQYNVSDGTIVREVTYIKYRLVARLPTDLNNDRTVNILDITIVAAAYNTRPGDEKWNAAADFDKNGTVNILDISAVAKDYGKTV